MRAPSVVQLIVSTSSTTGHWSSFVARTRGTTVPATSTFVHQHFFLVRKSTAALVAFVCLRGTKRSVVGSFVQSVISMSLLTKNSLAHPFMNLKPTFGKRTVAMLAGVQFHRRGNFHGQQPSSFFLWCLLWHLLWCLLWCLLLCLIVPRPIGNRGTSEISVLCFFLLIFLFFLLSSHFVRGSVSNGSGRTSTLPARRYFFPPSLFFPLYLVLLCLVHLCLTLLVLLLLLHHHRRRTRRRRTHRRRHSRTVPFQMLQQMGTLARISAVGTKQRGHGIFPIRILRTTFHRG